MKNVFFLAVLLLLIGCHKLPKIDSGYIRTGNLNIYYESQGTGPEVLLLHAGLQDHDMWAKQVEALRDRHRVITVDMPGQGKSSGTDTTILIADVLVQVLDGLQIKKASVVGLSYGGASATDLVLAHPDRVNKLVLVSTGITGWEKFIKPDSLSFHYFALLDSVFKKKDAHESTEMFVKAWCDGPFRKPEQVNKEARDYVYTTTLRNLQQHPVNSWGKFSKETGAKRAGEIKNQVLIVYGDQDIPFIIEASHFLHRAIAGSKEVKFANVAHMLNLEAGNEFNGLITVFLD